MAAPSLWELGQQVRKFVGDAWKDGSWLHRSTEPRDLMSEPKVPLPGEGGWVGAEGSSKGTREGTASWVEES